MVFIDLHRSLHLICFFCSGSQDLLRQHKLNCDISEVYTPSFKIHAQGARSRFRSGICQTPLLSFGLEGIPLETFSLCVAACVSFAVQVKAFRPHFDSATLISDWCITHMSMFLWIVLHSQFFVYCLNGAIFRRLSQICVVISH